MAALVVALLTGALPIRRSPPAPTAAAPRPAAAPQGVAALGRLEPAGDVRILAAPITGVGGSPRITELLVSEGDAVTPGQLLAQFDNGPTQEAELQLLRTRISTLEQRLQIQTRDLQRYRQLTTEGAVPIEEYDRREQDYLLLQGQLLEARAQLEKVEADLVNTELRAPIHGTVLRVNARVGERPGDRGVLELGDSERMEALLEVYESDINRVRLGQTVRISSENGGFEGNLRGTVRQISPQVRQREVLSTDPTGDVDARIVEVRVRLDPADVQRVRSLSGLKVVGRLAP